jgi:chromosomal replication initiator protein
MFFGMHEGKTMDKAAESVRADNLDESAVAGILGRLQQRVGPQKYNAWFRHGAHVGIDDEHVTVSVPNPFVANWIATHYQAEIAEAAVEETGRRRAVVVTIDPSLTRDIRTHQLDSQADIVTKAKQGRTRRRRPPEASPLRHSLDDFVVGTSNKLAYSAAMALAGGAAPFETLFVHGPCGVGKTHLLQGICRAFSKRRRNGRPLRWKYVTAEQFTNEFIQTLRGKKMGEFRARYRNVDLLAIDDVHFLAAKKATQDEFLHTFNAIQEAGRPVVMASDAHPRLVGQLNVQLSSRFLAGMVVKIESPDRDTRMEILRRKARSMRLRVGRDVLDYVAQHVRGSVRELEGSLIKLAALAALAAGPVTLEMATDAMADHLARTDSIITLGDIEAAVATFFGMTPADIHSSRRTRTVSAARTVAMFLARRHTRMSFPEIGRHMGKNHSSVVLGVQRMEKLLAAKGDIIWESPAGRKSMKASKLIELLSEQFAH